MVSAAHGFAGQGLEQGSPAAGLAGASGTAEVGNGFPPGPPVIPLLDHSRSNQASAAGPALS